MACPQLSNNQNSERELEDSVAEFELLMANFKCTMTCYNAPELFSASQWMMVLDTVNKHDANELQLAIDFLIFFLEGPGHRIFKGEPFNAVPLNKPFMSLRKLLDESKNKRSTCDFDGHANESKKDSFESSACIEKLKEKEVLPKTKVRIGASASVPNTAACKTEI